MSTDALLAIIAGRDTTGLYEVRCRRPTDGRIAAREWFELHEREACLRFILARASSLDVYVGVALRDRREGGKAAISRVWCLWADVDAPAALERLKAYHPSPSLIVRSGSGTNVHAYWALSPPLSPAWAERANRRLAHHLGADMKSTDAARILRPPGSLNHKSSPPASVRVVQRRPGAMAVGPIVGNLPDPPSKSSKARTPKADVHTNDPLLGISADRFYTQLTGRPVTGSYVTCPFHKDGAERFPSLRLYDFDGWNCFGCGVGGSIYQFAAMLWGYALPLRGSDFVELRERLTTEMGL